jgi:hypothetical protein
VIDKESRHCFITEGHFDNRCNLLVGGRRLGSQFGDLPLPIEYSSTDDLRQLRDAVIETSVVAWRRLLVRDRGDSEGGPPAHILSLINERESASAFRSA